MLGLTAMIFAAICVLEYFAISRALRPARDIMAGLDRLSRGDLSCRMPSFRLAELQRISEVFNTLAASLDRTARERSALAVRLVDGQERERSHLARELHDELGQNLSAMSALAASIKATAEAECPALLAEANNLAHAAMAAMKSLRTTLRTLRPPEIDDFGLAASLSTLVRDQERRAGRDLKISLEADGDLRDLQPSAASHIYRIIQEGLTNVVKHATGRRARVSLAIESDPEDRPAGRRRWLRVTIENDGCRAIREEGEEGGGFGLIGMRERVMALDGHLDVIQLGSRGFTLRAMIPLDMATDPSDEQEYNPRSSCR